MAKSKQKVNKRCENCKWRGINDKYEGTTADYFFMGQCWRYPKRFNTRDNDFCGEFKQRSNPT